MFSLDLGNLLVHLRMDATQFAAGLKGAEKAMMVTSRKMTTIGTKMSMALTLPLVGIGAAATKGFAGFDDAMTKSLAIMGNVSDQMRQEMEQVAIDVSKSSVTSSQEMAKSYFYLASAGMNAAQSIAALPAVEKFAVAGAFDMARATDLATDALSALGLKSEDAQVNLKNLIRVTDLLVGANQLANASTEQFSLALTASAGSTMKAFKIAVEDGMSVLAAYADQGKKAEEAGNLFTRMILLTTKGFQENRAAWNQFNIDIYDATGHLKPLHEIVGDLSEVFKTMSPEVRTATLDMLGFAARSQKAILPLLGLQDSIKGYNEKMVAMKDVTEETANKQLKSFSSQMKISMNHLKEMGRQIGEEIAPMIADFGEKIRGMTEGWDKLNDATKKSIVRWGLIVAAIGPVIWTIGKLIAVFVGLIKVIALAAAASKAFLLLWATNPAAMIVAALAIAGVAIWKYIDSIETATTKTKQFARAQAELVSTADALAAANAKIARANEVGDSAGVATGIQMKIDALKQASEMLRKADIDTGKQKPITPVAELARIVPGKVMEQGIGKDLVRTMMPSPADAQNEWDRIWKTIDYGKLVKIEAENAIKGVYQGSVPNEMVVNLQKSLDNAVKHDYANEITPMDWNKWIDEQGLIRETIRTEEQAKAWVEKLSAAVEKSYDIKGVRTNDAIALIESEIIVQQEELAVINMIAEANERARVAAEDAANAAAGGGGRKGASEEVKKMIEGAKFELEMTSKTATERAKLTRMKEFEVALGKEMNSDSAEYVELMSQYMGIVNQIVEKESEKGSNAKSMIKDLQFELEITGLLNETRERAIAMREFEIALQEEYTAGTEEYIALMEQYGQLLDDIGEKQRIGENMQKWKLYAEQTLDVWGNVTDTMIQGLQGVGRGLTEMLTEGTFEWKEFARQVIKQLINIMIQALLVRAIMMMIPGLNVMVAAGGAAGAAAGAGAGAAGSFATGGTGQGAGTGTGNTGGGTTGVHQFHTGGIVGGGALKSDERVIKAQTGELLVSKDDIRDARGGDSEEGSGGGAGQFKIVNVLEKSEMLNALATVEGEQLVMNIMKRNRGTVSSMIG